jgi:hypothetical protein
MVILDENLPARQVSLLRNWGGRVRVVSVEIARLGIKDEWPASDKQPAVKIIFDRSTGEVRVVGRSGGQLFQKTFVVGNDLRQTPAQAHEFIAEQLRR